MTTENKNTDDLPFQATASFVEQRIARVYAQALMNAADEKHAIDEVKGDLNAFVGEILDKHADFEQFLASGIIGRDTKQHVIDRVFKDKTSALFFNFLKVLAEHDRLPLIRAVANAFRKLDDERNRRIPVLVKSAVPLSEEQTNRLRDDLKINFELDPILHTAVDPSLLGGVVVRVGDWVFDRSVRSQLLDIRKQLLARSGSEIQNFRDRFASATGE